MNGVPSLLKALRATVPEGRTALGADEIDRLRSLTRELVACCAAN
jgi:hypothetical protein